MSDSSWGYSSDAKSCGMLVSSSRCVLLLFIKMYTERAALSMKDRNQICAAEVLQILSPKLNTFSTLCKHIIAVQKRICRLHWIELRWSRSLMYSLLSSENASIIDNFYDSNLTDAKGNTPTSQAERHASHIVQLYSLVTRELCWLSPYQECSFLDTFATSTGLLQDCTQRWGRVMWDNEFNSSWG